MLGAISFMATSSVMKKLSWATVGVAFITLEVELPNAAQAASVTFITSRTELRGNDSVDWEVVGPAFSEVPNPFSVTSSSGLRLKVSKATGIFSRVEQTSAPDGPFSANFAPGDALISTTRQTTGPVTIAFSSPVAGAGTQLESFGNGAFNATIEALDSVGNSLGTFSVPGIASYGGTGDNTVPFVGVFSKSANIASLKINGERVPGVGFAFNRLDIVSTTVPESDFSALSAIAFGGFLGAELLLRRKRK